ncbi:hypothetical protein [Limibacterium fermenti]|uniref:hypothetical protein n=1 Tax=Limibacterium fermenti TaxID=3229863 RepID=UPI003A637FB7
MKRFAFLILAIVLSGCVSKKTATKETVKQDVVVTMDSTSEETITENNREDSVKETATSLTDRTVTRTTETEYSAPDTTGEQHKIRERTTERLNDIALQNEEYVKTIREQRQETGRLTERNTELQAKLDAAVQSKSQATSRNPLWTYIVVFAAGALFVPGIKLLIRK